jgi:tetratricopeptide (TPR) repeat protein
MNKFRFSFLVAVVIGIGSAKAQSVEQGLKYYYYERYKSAQETFQKVLAANPNNLDAVYWLGETMVHRVDTRDTVGAKSLFSSMLATNGTAPMLLAGMGHIELMQGNTTDARQRFETAISLTKAKDINVLNAVGYANVDAKAGDANYAIDKLNLATQTKNFHNAETYILLGDAYHKLFDGGNAVINYQKALSIDPNLAEAQFKIGLIYLSQNNKEYFLPAFDKAVSMDPAYAPAYYQLYYYWYYRDVNKASDYLDKYIANTDQGPEVEYAKAALLYVSRKYAEAKAKALELINKYGDHVSPAMYRMVAYSADSLNDLATSRQAMTTFFSKADTSIILGSDYEEMANLDARSTDSATREMAFQYYEMAISRDTLMDDKEKFIAEATDLSKKIKDKQAAAEFAAVNYHLQKYPNQSDLYAWGFANYSAGNFKTADSIFCGIYEAKFPDAIYGYLWCAKSKFAQDDSLASKGVAVDAYEKLAEIAKKQDSVKNKAYILESYFYLAGYYNNVKKDKEKAISYLQKVLWVDPTNATAKQYIEILSRKPKPQPATKPKSGTQ